MDNVFVIDWGYNTAPTVYANAEAIHKGFSELYAEDAVERQTMETAIRLASEQPGDAVDLGDGDTLTLVPLLS